MPLPSHTRSAHDAFFDPIRGVARRSPSHRPCLDLSDEQWLVLDLHRVLESTPSGRGFLQENGPRSNYFSSLVSERLGEVARDVNALLLAAAEAGVHIATISDLARYRCFASDGHWHGAKAHDSRGESGSKPVVGHFYSLDMHNHRLRHLAAAEAPQEYDMSIVKRLGPRGLEEGVAMRSRMLRVHDRAGIDFKFWGRCRRECAPYCLCRVKEGMVFEHLEDWDLDATDPRNRSSPRRTTDGRRTRLR